MHVTLRPVSAIQNRIFALEVDKDNLIQAMAAVGSLEKLKLGQDIATTLETRCIKFACDKLDSASTLGKAVTMDNFYLKWKEWPAE